jgi:hypothetical protein
MVTETIYIYNTILKKVGRVIPLKKFAFVLYGTDKFISSFEIVGPEDLKFYRQVSADFVKKAAADYEIDVSDLVSEYFSDAVQQINLSLKEEGFDRSAIRELSEFFGRIVSARPTSLYFSTLLPLVEYAVPLAYKTEVKESPHGIVRILPKEKGPGYQLNPFPFIVKSFVNLAKILAYTLFPQETIFEIVRGLIDDDETMLNNVCNKYETELKRSFNSIVEHAKPLFEQTVAEKEELYEQLTLLPDPDTAINEIIDNVKEKFKDKVKVVKRKFIEESGYVSELLEGLVYDIMTDVVKNANEYFMFGGHPGYRQEYLIDAVLYAITKNIKEAEDLEDETKKQNIKDHIESTLSPYNVVFKEDGFEKFYALVKETLEPVLKMTGKIVDFDEVQDIIKEVYGITEGGPAKVFDTILNNFLRDQLNRGIERGYVEKFLLVPSEGTVESPMSKFTIKREVEERLVNTVRQTSRHFIAKLRELVPFVTEKLKEKLKEVIGVDVEVNESRVREGLSGFVEWLNGKIQNFTAIDPIAVLVFNAYYSFLERAGQKVFDKIENEQVRKILETISEEVAERLAMTKQGRVLEIGGDRYVCLKVDGNKLVLANYDELMSEGCTDPVTCDLSIDFVDTGIDINETLVRCPADGAIVREASMCASCPYGLSYDNCSACVYDSLVKAAQLTSKSPKVVVTAKNNVIDKLYDTISFKKMKKPVKTVDGSILVYDCVMHRKTGMLGVVTEKNIDGSLKVLWAGSSKELPTWEQEVVKIDEESLK